MVRQTSRRSFLKVSMAVAVGGLARHTVHAAEKGFKISLAEWSLHRAIFGGRMTNLDFPRVARREFGIEAIEFVNQFFFDKARDEAYLKELKKRCEDEGVRPLLIMCDREGALGDPDPAKREQAVKNHYKWVDAARFLGCHSIRVNAQSRGSYEEQLKLAADGLARLTEYGASQKINILVENHGGLSSNGKWLAAVIERVNSPWCGTLPDFGNWRDYDKYQGVKELMPYAKAVSAKSYDFDEQGNETTIDYYRMMKIVLDAGYHGYVGIEYEGRRLPEPQGIMATKRLLERVREKLVG